MQKTVLTNLRRDFTAAISSDQNDVTLDAAVAGLRERISQAGFLEPLSIYSRGQLREMNEALSAISTVRLKDDPFKVALAVDAVLKLFNRLETTIKQSQASHARIEAGRSSK
jgi:hypothetical protein